MLACFAGLRWLGGRVKASARVEAALQRAPLVVTIWAMGGLAFAWTLERVLAFWG